jgi:N-dimethylarginine dimethylaminohydrolase
MSHELNEAPATNGRPVAVDRSSPTRVRRPAFLLNPPFSFCADVPNNRWMEELPADQRQPNRERAMLQFLELYRFIAGEALVYLLPTPKEVTLQDQVFTANLGIVLEGRGDTVVISNYTSEPRRGETRVGAEFFSAMGYDVHVSPHRFEGEADLKHLHDDVYVGGYGIRSERETFEWMERRFGVKILKLRLTDTYLYHLDCSIFPVTAEDTLVCTEMFEEAEIAALEEHTNVIDVSVDDCYSGITNTVRLSNTLMNASNLHELKAGTEDYRFEVAKNRRLEDIANGLAFEVSYFNLSEFLKGGALLSCMAMHLNRHSYRFALTT